MEKFGIFDLLDTLSAITEQGESVPDASLREPPAPAAAPPRTQTTGALDSFLSRHDAISKKIDKAGK